MKKVIKGMLILLLTFLFIGCNDEKANNNESKVLKVGMELAYPPFEMSDKEGNPTGVSVDFAKMLARSMNKELIIENIAWDGLIPSLKTGKIDIIISSMTITDERKKSIDFSIPYAKSALAILANKNSNINSIEDLKEKTIAVKKGSTGHIYAKENFPNGNILVFDKESACVLEVVQGKADGFLYDQLTIYRNHQNHKDTTVALLKPFQKDFEYWGVALKKDNTELKNQIDQFITKAKEDGTFDDFAYKYLKDAKQTFDSLNIEFFF
ncbi:amino acid ABC transporter substrate-binding protein [Malaciobacter mytili LMG 24559]|uniref:Amino acid ABC transporter substrate-binding protein n=1 Tax=Malaciobacter mytili LMG 24559 TaxID=1032238 RepID=A0AAX2AKF0_9BACT|nr:transporter substrate-binding domain-containing protein [Malaciobacter mytili]AXH14403.1 amino acid ABC transporter, periplasmic amino acid-binding protein [Malaciobacter mytili LMG 24559]RXK16021.1 amino acid ABC transporter substrate-binding protein [Malaciobacter mytili LMG 24559]